MEETSVFESTLNDMGIPTRYKNGKRLDLADLMKVIAKKWDKLSKEDKTSIAEEILKETEEE